MYRDHFEKYKHRRRSEFESAGPNWNVGAVGIEMPKFEAKKGDFAKILQKLGGYSPPPALPSMINHSTSFTIKMLLCFGFAIALLIDELSLANVIL